MQLSRILPLVVGGAVAGIVVSGASPAQALTWTWNYTDGAGINASGTFTTNDTPNGSGFYTITDITGTRNGIAITGLSAPGGLGGNDNLISQSSPYLTFNGFTYSWNGSFVNVYNQGNGTWRSGVNSANSGTSFNGDLTSITFTASVNPSPTPVPFDIPGGATIPTVGSVFALGLMRKAKKSLAVKTRVANPEKTLVS
jgi:hypothetical protein